MANNLDLKMERSSGKLLQLLEKDGWKVERIAGSHHVLKKPGAKHPIVLVHPKKDRPIGLVRQIYKDVGWRT